MKIRRLLFVMLLFLLAGSVALAWRFYSALSTPYLDQAGEVIVDLPLGWRADEIADRLVAAGVLQERMPFLLYLRWNGSSRHIQAGEYRFSAPATPIQVAHRLLSGDVYHESVTIPEGLTARETVHLIAGKGLGDLEELERCLGRTDWIRDLDDQAESLEGYLFPNTYRLPRKVTSDEIVKAMVREFRNQIETLIAAHPMPEDWNVRRIVILASLIEKEVKYDNERGLVASVLVNRLRRRIPLACDPTIIYALKLAGRYNGNISKADLSMDSPYNSYIHPDLPPGPIANPGAESLKAALNPADTKYLYFVSKNDGTHHFSDNFRSHQSAVERYQKRWDKR